MKLQDRVAVVTGGGRAVGKAISRRLAHDGAHLVLAAPEQDEIEETAAEIESLGRKALAVVTDVSNEEDVIHLSEATHKAFGRVDILVNNAGIIGPTAAVPDVTRLDWDEVLAVNLTGAFLCAKVFLPEMIAHRSGRIINISSIAGKIGYALRSPYSVSKWGMIGLTMSIAKEVGEHDIQVNAVCPGPVDGERMQTLMATRAEEQGRSVEEVVQEYTEQMVLGRFVQAEDVAALVAFLASDDARNITGQALDVSAGWRV